MSLNLSDPTPEVGDPAAPRGDECLCCYLLRMLDAFDCDNSLRWAVRWRNELAPALDGLECDLVDRGGFCDCEVVMNAYWPAYELDDQAAPPGCRATRSNRPVVACSLFS